MPITRPKVVLAALASASSIRLLPNELKSVVVKESTPLAYISLSVLVETLANPVKVASKG